ncbi:hypothetical protein [Jiulongibacter sp. NS-SX5]|uniref:hypothetical protein n=1 Tax=Jiulongibacter sp. NS-SX5 TaxID=3463854 RepID=UPI0040584EAD
MKTKISLFLALLFALVFMSSRAASIQYTCVNGGWDESTCWSGGVKPTSTDDAIIPIGHTVTVSTLEHINSVICTGNITVAVGGNFNVSGTLNLLSGGSNKINVYGVFNILGGALSTSINTEVIVRAGGILFGGNSNFDCITNNGKFKVNQGADVFILNSINTAIVNNALLINNGVIEVFGGNKGIFTTGYDGDSLINNQIIKISNCSSNGIESDGGIILNNDRIRIEDCGEESFYGHGDNSIGESILWNSEGARLEFLCGVNNVDSLYNQGKIYVFGDNGYISRIGSGYNHDSIYVSTKNSTGLSLVDFVNTSEGVITTDSVIIDDGNTYNFISSGRGALNQGQIHINGKGVIKGFYGDGGGINEGEIFIENTTIGLNLKEYLNASEGHIYIDTTSVYGVYVEFDSSRNEGEIHLKNAAGEGIGLSIRSFGELYNNGLLHLESHTDSYLIESYSGTFVNEEDGRLTGTYSGDESTFLNDRTEFLNLGTVDITINGADARGLELTDHQSQKFTNKGNFFLRNTELGNETMASIEGLLLNDSCATLFLGVGHTLTATGEILNYGKLIFDGSANIENMNAFVNHGVIESLNGIHSSEVSQNLGFISSPFFHGLTNGFIYNAGIESVLPVPSSWYSNAFETTVNGTFDSIAMDYQVAATDAADTVYFTIDYLDICTSQIRKPVLLNEKPYCSTVQTNTFNASQSDDWFLKENWSAESIPNACDIVLIPNGISAKVSSNNYAEALRLEAETGSVFETESGAVLDVKN